MSEETKPTGLEILRAPFPEAYISKLPKGTKAQNECPPSEKINCAICGGWHHPKIIHLDYVGHAAVTQRLLDADPTWNWRPLAYDEDGLPKRDEIGGLWISLTVGDVTRLGYGDATGKTGANALKEAIGDAIRNAAMRFGVALELWHKGDWEEDTISSLTEEQPITDEQVIRLGELLEESNSDPAAFMRFMNVANLTEIRSKNYDLAEKTILKKIAVAKTKKAAPE